MATSRQNDLISIAITTYNGEKFLQKQLDSIFQQTIKNIEVVVCDDRSTDGTVAILENYKKKHGLRYFINDKNLGFFKNFERVLGFCEGTLIALSDQDDIWLPKKLERLKKSIGNFSLVYSDVSFIDDNDHMVAESATTFAGLLPLSGKPFRILAFNNFVIGCTVMITRDLLRIAMPFPDGAYAHDYWLAVVACKRNGIYYCNERLVQYRLHSGNTIGMRKKPSLPTKIFGFLYQKSNMTPVAVQEKRLQNLSECALFSYEERKFLSMAYEYFHDRLTTFIHVKAFFIAVRNSSNIFPGVHWLWRAKQVFGTLLR
jgi:glycosyltransferase involved in cell wall biosynthesis